MISLTKTIKDPNNIVFKLIFEDSEAIAEAVVYRYGCRGVICFSVQSGCRVGCSFCGTGKRFIRDLNVEEMYLQIKEGLKLLGGYEKIQLMSMSMGEPMDNISNVSNLVCELNYQHSIDIIPKHDFFLSTVGINNSASIIELMRLFNYDHFGLQFSLHHYDNEKRIKLLGNYKELMDLDRIKSIANHFKFMTGKRAYFNYLCTGKDNKETAEKVAKIVNGHHLTCSVLCNTKKLSQGEATHADNFMNHIHSLGNVYDIEMSIFNPAGQDTIGGGCGQLLYVQKKLNNEV